MSFALLASPALAHPHVFVGGGVDFVIRDGAVLDALNVTWIHDEFETLYILSSLGLSLNAEGELDERDRRQLVEQKSNWPEDFDGSAHLSQAKKNLALEWPENLNAHMVDGRLALTFTRRLSVPIDLREQEASVAFYEATYFFAFSITQTPKLLGDVGTCEAKVIPLEQTADSSALQNVLAKLGREETPQIANVGEKFADRITLACH